MTSNENNRSSKMPIPDELASVAGGVQSGGALNPLMIMLNVYYETAMTETDPVKKAEAVRIYNQTLTQMMRDGVNCAGYHLIQR